MQQQCPLKRRRPQCSQKRYHFMTTVHPWKMMKTPMHRKYRLQRRTRAVATFLKPSLPSQRRAKRAVAPRYPPKRTSLDQAHQARSPLHSMQGGYLALVPLAYSSKESPPAWPPPPLMTWPHSKIKETMTIRTSWMTSSGAAPPQRPCTALTASRNRRIASPAALRSVALHPRAATV